MEHGARGTEHRAWSTGHRAQGTEESNFEYNMKKTGNLKLEGEGFPSFFKEGWLRPQFSLRVLFSGGDGVVKEKSRCLIFTTSPISIIMTL